MASTTYEYFVDIGKMVTFCHHFAVIGNMVRNAGQLPEPFWLGARNTGGFASSEVSVNAFQPVAYRRPAVMCLCCDVRQREPLNVPQ